jgi:Family of unknown function (DUF6599)
MGTVVAFLLAVVAPRPAVGTFAPDCGLVAGWSQEGPPRSFDRETLFDYMDGNSEGYFAYGFSLMKGVTCVDDAGDRFVIDVSEMGDPAHAWGFFVANRDLRSPDERVGAAGQVLARRATFAKGRYYVEIAAGPDKDHSPALRAFATALEARLPGRAAPPAQVDWFPKEGLEAGSVRLVPQSVLGIRTLESGWTARYASGRAFLVEAKSEEEAAARLGSLRPRFAGATDVEGLGEEAFAAHDQYLGDVVAFRQGSLLAGVANADSPSAATALAHRLAGSLPGVPPPGR